MTDRTAEKRRYICAGEGDRGWEETRKLQPVEEYIAEMQAHLDALACRLRARPTG